MGEERWRADRQLAARIGAGDATALEAVYDAYAGAVYRHALAIVGCASDAEDVLQDVFVHLVRRRGRPIEDLRAYLLAAARHQAFSVLRRRRRVDLGYDGDLPVRPSGAPEPGDMAAVREALAALPAEQREVVVLKVYGQLTFAEIGRAVKASANTVASRYRYGVKKLREALGDTADVR
jgi:RNA polymerase sigma-70 factor (ECF subfamily)